MSLLQWRCQGRGVIAPSISEAEISARLRENYTPGLITATDEYALRAMDQPLKCAAVLIPLVCKQDGWHLLLTRRTDVVATHKGQVSFPGGACDAAESTAEGTALREAEEEIGLAPADVRLLGRIERRGDDHPLPGDPGRGRNPMAVSVPACSSGSGAHIQHPPGLAGGTQALERSALHFGGRAQGSPGGDLPKV